jgi:hypothetical protein
MMKTPSLRKELHGCGNSSPHLESERARIRILKEENMKSGSIEITNTSQWPSRCFATALRKPPRSSKEGEDDQLNNYGWILDGIGRFIQLTQTAIDLPSEVKRRTNETSTISS